MVSPWGNTVLSSTKTKENYLSCLCLGHLQDALGCLLFLYHLMAIVGTREMTRQLWNHPGKAGSRKKIL